MTVRRRALFAQVLLTGLVDWLLARRATAAENVTYEYDALGRLTKVTYGDGRTITYAYDPAGNRTMVTPPAGTPPTGAFAANPTTINQGSSSTLSWTSTNATTASIDNGVGNVTPVASGSRSVSPASTTTYTLTLTGAGGQTTKQATVTVMTATLSANPTTITAGSSSTLSWTSANATSVSINNGVGSVNPVAGGSVSVSPAATTTYTATITGPSGQITRQATVTVSAAPPPTGTLTANPATITQGGSSTLSWTSANAASVVINNGVGSVTPVASGSTSVSPAATTTYTATITGAGGQITRQATVTVTSDPTTIAVTGTAPVNLRALANNAGYNGQNATYIFEVNNGVTITGQAGTFGAPAGGIAIDTGDWPTGSYTINLTLRVKTGGKVYAGGGGGGAGATQSQMGSTGGVGGDAVYARCNLAVVVDSGGEIKAGGGGGGGGGCAIIGSQFGLTVATGGRGGGGFPNGQGSPGASSGTTSGGGAGGAGATNGGAIGGAGGNGGNAAAAGMNGANGSPTAVPPGAGGGAGYAIRKNGNTVSVTNNGTITGTQG